MARSSRSTCGPAWWSRYAVVVSVTGAALVSRIHLQRTAHPELLSAGADGPQADIATVIEPVRGAYPRGAVSGSMRRPRCGRPHLAYVTEGGRFHTVLIDPVTAEVLGELLERSAVRTLQDLHFDLLAGPRAAPSTASAHSASFCSA